MSPKAVCLCTFVTVLVLHINSTPLPLKSVIFVMYGSTAVSKNAVACSQINVYSLVVR